MNTDQLTQGDVRIWLFLFRSKTILLVSVLVAFILALLLYMIAEPVYESRATFGIGYYFSSNGQEKEIESSDQLVTRLNREYDVQAYDDSDFTLPRLSVARPDTQVGHYIVLEAQAHDPQGAQHFLRQVIEKILQNHDDITEAGYRNINQAINHKKRQIAELERQIDELSDQIRRFIQTNPSLAVILTFEKVKLTERRVPLKDSLLRLEQTKRSLAGKESAIVTPPSMPNEPISPGLHLYMSLAGFFGIAAGVLGGLLKEQIKAVSKTVKS